MSVIRCGTCGEFAWGTTQDDAEMGVEPDGDCPECGAHDWFFQELTQSEADELGIDYVLADDPDSWGEGDDGGEGLLESCPACGGEIYDGSENGRWDADGVCFDCGEYYGEVGA